jgi:hypothetical protein
VNYPVRRWRPAVLVLAVVLALAVPLPVLAAEGSQPAAKPGLKASIPHAVASARVTAAPVKARAVREQASSGARAELGSKSFFRTPAGVAVLAIVGAGAGYAVYSASHDRIHSVVRQGQ